MELDDLTVSIDLNNFGFFKSIMSNYTIETNKTNYSEKNEDQIEICLGKSLDFSELENQVRFN